MDIFSIIKLLCGLTFFLFGMKVMSGDLEKLAGGKLEQLLKKFTANPALSMLLGAVITIAVQSSSAVTVMLVGLVNSGIMQFAQTVFVIFGANIGTTLTAWILSLSGLESSAVALQMLKPENFSPLLAFVGVMFAMFSKKEKRRSIGTIFVGFAVLMYGMVFMTQAVSPLAETPGFSDALVKFNNPILGVLIGTVITAAIQSSAASIGILQALSLTGSISYGMAAPIVMGQNIGTCVTSLMSCIGTGAKAKRVAILHFSIKVIGTVICLSVFCAVRAIFAPALLESAVTPWGVAAIHTVFNVATTAILAPLSKLLVRLTERIVKEKSAPDKREHLFNLDERLLNTPSVAVKECDHYVGNMARDARDMLLASFALLGKFDEETARWIRKMEDTCDSYEDDIGSYLVKLSGAALSDADAAETEKMHHAIGNYERLGDHSVNLVEVARDMDKKSIRFSDEAYAELTVVVDALVDILNLTVSCYTGDDSQLAHRVEPLEQVIDDLIETMQFRHNERVQKGECTIELGFILSDILNNFERISDHCSNIAVAVIEAHRRRFDAHSYLNGVKHGNEDFNRIFEEYAGKYYLV